MKVLLGTTNPSKVHNFSNLLKDCEIEFITLKDIEIASEPEENGKTPEENAILKAKFYGQYFDTVICNDCGLYFEELSLDDCRQPGLNVLTPMNMQRLSDEQMIEYYSKLIKELGGRVSAFYLDGIAVYNHGEIYSFMEKENARKTGFDMIDKAAPKYFPGWPLNSLSINRETRKYFGDEKDTNSKENIFAKQYKKQIVNFLKKALNIAD